MIQTIQTSDAPDRANFQPAIAGSLQTSVNIQARIQELQRQAVERLDPLNDRLEELREEERKRAEEEQKRAEQSFTWEGESVANQETQIGYAEKTATSSEAALVAQHEGNQTIDRMLGETRAQSFLMHHASVVSTANFDRVVAAVQQNHVDVNPIVSALGQIKEELRELRQSNQQNHAAIIAELGEVTRRVEDAIDNSAQDAQIIADAIADQQSPQMPI